MSMRLRSTPAFSRSSAFTFCSHRVTSAESSLMRFCSWAIRSSSAATSILASSKSYWTCSSNADVVCAIAVFNPRNRPTVASSRCPSCFRFVTWRIRSLMRVMLSCNCLPSYSRMSSRTRSWTEPIFL
ncbi:hypothetical protein Y027_5402 [Burkholderia pseudomallei TSV5]|nr:hypothetical protein DP49_4248 [Burkholderia pseudomallei]KGX50630.1 hypothetical protein Y027_5402 [Burkholderia pseudomallei TSV5]